MIDKTCYKYFNNLSDTKLYLLILLFTRLFTAPVCFLMLQLHRLFGWLSNGIFPNGILRIIIYPS